MRQPRFIRRLRRKVKLPKTPSVDFRSISSTDKRKFALLIGILIVMIVITVLVFPYFKDLLNADTRGQFVADIRSRGPWGVLILLALQVLQVVIAFIPGEFVQIAAGVVYGTFGGWLICTLGTALSSALVYKLVDRLGMPFVEDMISPKMAKRLEFMSNNKKIDLIMFVLFFIPGLPKDVFTYFAPVTKMPLKRFLVLTLVARSPALIASTYGGAAFTQGDYGKMILIFAIFGALGILGIIFKDRILDFFNDKKQKIVERRLAASQKRHGMLGPSGNGPRLSSGRDDKPAGDPDGSDGAR